LLRAWRSSKTGRLVGVSVSVSVDVSVSVSVVVNEQNRELSYERLDVYQCAIELLATSSAIIILDALHVLGHVHSDQRPQAKSLVVRIVSMLSRMRA